ncbi:UDP-glucose 4-epimerase GalE [bacterium]|nr:UDP-glucose 4-epimerase GalE [bacterium]
MNKILVTGGAGYIGSHCVLRLLKDGVKVVVFDNLSTGHIETLDTLKKYGDLIFVKGDLQNKEDLKNVFKEGDISAVIHFAAFSQVGESVKDPQKYYFNNVYGTLNLLEAMLQKNVKRIVFSSTAATYGEPNYVPIDENHVQNPVNPYGNTKFFIEKILDDYDKAYGLKSIRLRYFNVAGASSEGVVGEWHEPETHLIPNVLKSALDESKVFKLFGSDYDTKDGTCVRDYINIEDLIDAHIKALNYIFENNKTDYFNLGTKTGNSIKEVFSLCEKAIDKKINIEMCPRRDGDPAILVADNGKAKEILGWNSEKSLEHSIKTAYEWENNLLRKFKT